MRPSNLPHIAGAVGVVAGLLAANFEPTFRVSREFAFDAPVAVRSPSSTPDETEITAATPPKLLFITFDGVRPNEVFDCAEEKNLTTSKCSLPFLTGEQRAGRFELYPMVVGNSRNLSLPGYQTIYSGAAQESTCKDNDWCSRVPVKTWLENITIKRRLRWWQTAAIASWSKIAIAFEKNQGTIHVNVGKSAMKDPRTGAVPYDLDLQSKWQFDPGNNPQWNDKPGKSSRYDRFTYLYSQWYLTHVKPDILVMSLLDSDEYGHLDNFTKYKKSLRTYDGYLKNMVADLKYAGTYEDTIIMITTDHGRGKDYFGYAFQGHGTGFGLEHSNQTWIAVSVPPRLKKRWGEVRSQILSNIKARKGFLDQTDIRTAVEGLMLPANGH